MAEKTPTFMRGIVKCRRWSETPASTAGTDQDFPRRWTLRLARKRRMFSAVSPVDPLDGLHAVEGHVRGKNHVRTRQQSLVAQQVFQFLRCCLPARGRATPPAAVTLVEPLDDLLADDARRLLPDEAVLFQHVEPRAADLPGIERLQQRVGIDQAAPRRVDDDYSPPAAGERVTIEEVVGFRQQRNVQRQEVRFRQQTLQRRRFAVFHLRRTRDCPRCRTSGFSCRRPAPCGSRAGRCGPHRSLPSVLPRNSNARTAS